MATTTIETDTELSAVNSILGAIGQSPLTQLNFDNPEVQFLYNLLRDSNVDTQSEGWHFNTEYHVDFPADVDGHIKISADIISLDAHDNYTKRSTDYVRRNGLLYDKIKHTDVHEGTITLDVVKLYAFEDLPTPFQRYITYRAAVKAATQLVANPNLVKMLQQQESVARAALMEYECNQGDHSMLQFEEESAYQTYQPWRNLRR